MSGSAFPFRSGVDTMRVSYCYYNWLGLMATFTTRVFSSYLLPKFVLIISFKVAHILMKLAVRLSVGLRSVCRSLSDTMHQQEALNEAQFQSKKL